MNSLLSDQRVAIIGAGTMGETLLAAILDAKLLTPDAITATTLDDQRISYLEEKYGITVTKKNEEATRSADIVLLCLKPQVYPSWLSNVDHEIRDDQLVISIMAGVTIDGLRANMTADPAVIRAMPNTPAQIRAGMTVITGSDDTRPEDLDRAETLFNAVGRTMRLEEKHFDAVTSLSASGPAFIYVVLEALAEGGVKTGLPRSVATELVAQMALGASSMVIKTGTHPAILKDHVTTPAGCTIDGLLTLEEGGLRVALIKAVVETARRAGELGDEE